MGSFLLQIWKGMLVDIYAKKGVTTKLTTTVRLGLMLLAYILGLVALIPYAASTLHLYWRLPEPRQQRSSHDLRVPEVTVKKNVRYGPKPRNVVDIYVPGRFSNFPENPLPGGVDGSLAPVVFFCHGGIWASGDKWHYAPMATRLAQLGIVCCVVQYTLFPEAVTEQMTQEVLAALRWVFQNVHSFGGDPAKVSIVGHSAGAHLGAMAILRHACDLQASNQQARAKQEEEQDKVMTQIQSTTSCVMVPFSFVGMAGVYDIAQHHDYEMDRGVNEISTMKRAIGGFASFGLMSPATILDSSASEALVSRAAHKQKENGMAHSEMMVDDDMTREEDKDSRFPSAATKYLPPFCMMGSRTDIIVPWQQGSCMLRALTRCGVASRHLLYNAKHTDYVLRWQIRRDFKKHSFTFDHDMTDLQPFQADLISIVKASAKFTNTSIKYMGDLIEFC